MTLYAFAANFNNVAGLLRLTPQPAGGGLVFTEWENSSLGLLVPQGRANSAFNYSYLPPSDFYSLLTQLSLSRSVTSRKGTFKLKDHETGYWLFWNGYINYPSFRRGLAHFESVSFPITGLRELT